MGASSRGKLPNDMSPIFTKFALSTNLKKVLQKYAEKTKIEYVADIFILAGLVILSLIIFGFLGFFLGGIMLKMDFSQMGSMISSPDCENSGFIKLYNVFITFGAWVVSGFLLAKIRYYHPNDLWHFNKPKVSHVFVLLPVLFLAAIVVAAYLLQLNQQINFPQPVRDVFSPERNQQMMECLLATANNKVLILNILVIALAPALFEEMFFRGTLQPLLVRATGSAHVGIIVASLLFAAIHMNISQIIPMFFLALVLGYLFHYSGSIWPGILVHFCNNGLAIMANYYKGNSLIAKAVADDTYTPGAIAVIISVLAMGGIFYYFIRQSRTVGINE